MKDFMKTDTPKTQLLQELSSDEITYVTGAAGGGAYAVSQSVMNNPLYRGSEVVNNPLYDTNSVNANPLY